MYVLSKLKLLNGSKLGNIDSKNNTMTQKYSYTLSYLKIHLLNGLKFILLINLINKFITNINSTMLQKLFYDLRKKLKKKNLIFISKLITFTLSIT